jgi:tellurite resistance protein TerC
MTALFDNPATIYGLFLLFIVGMLALDLGVFHRRPKAITVREALAWSGVWLGFGLAFAVFVHAAYGRGWFGLGATPDPVDGAALTAKGATLKYLTGYVVEKSLSIDNVFVIAMIFTAFAIPAMYQHRVLFWGVLGALVMRAVMILVSAQLVMRFHWILYVFGVFLLLTGLKMLFAGEGHKDPGHHPMVRLVRRLFPVTSRLHGEHFIVRAGTAASHEAEVPGAAVLPDPEVDKARPGMLMLTPLALTLILVETADLIFAVDSIPAIFAITGDPFLVFTSNVFAILGLRSLYFALAGLLDRFHYLKHALAIVLMVVGAKLLAAKWLKAMLGPNFNLYLLAVVVGIIAGGVVVSLVATRKRA